MLDVLCAGEALVDFLPQQRGQAVHEVRAWTPCSGGSPANVAVGVARLGGRAAMLGVVGKDEFGTFLAQGLAREGVDVSHLRRTAEGKTGLVFISLSEAGERSFAFYRTRAAELFLGPGDVDRSFVASARVLHVGTNSLLLPEAQRATLEMVRAARDAGRQVSCDPNLRLHLWSDPAELKTLLGELLPLCTIVKLADDETEFVTHTRDPNAALLWLEAKGVALPMVTRGALGAVFRWRGETVEVTAPAVKAVDATGAGDGFVAGVLREATRGEADFTKASVREVRAWVERGCWVGAQVVQQVGAVAGLPTVTD